MEEPWNVSYSVFLLTGKWLKIKGVKKQQIKKLSLHKIRISDLAQRTSMGGGEVDISLDTVCLTNIETICFSRCFGEPRCQLYRTDHTCNETITG